MKRVIKIVLGISFILYLFVLAVILFLRPREIWLDMPILEYIKYSSNIVPFKTISTYINAIFGGSMNTDIPIKNLIGNFILLLPMGIYLPFITKKINKMNILSIFMIILLFIIEVVQLVTRRGSFDIDDFILNIIGALIGFGIWKTKIFQKILN